MKNKIEQIENEKGEFIGFSFDISQSKESVLKHISYSGNKVKTLFNNQKLLFSNTASDYWGSWSIQNTQNDDFKNFPYIKSSQIEKYKQSNLSKEEFWINDFRKVIELNNYELLSNGIWKMVYSVSTNEDWNYFSSNVGRSALKGHSCLNEVFEMDNPRYHDFEGKNVPVAIKKQPFDDSGRVKFWRKKIREDSMPPILLVHLSHLSNAIIIDGHSRLQASILEGFCPEIITLYQITEQEIELNVEQVIRRSEALLTQYKRNPNLKLDQFNKLLISFYDDRPFLVRRSTAKFNRNEEEWNNAVSMLINKLKLNNNITRIEEEINEETGYNFR